MGTGTGRMDWRMKRRSAVCPVIDGLDTLRAAAERMWRQQTGALVLPERGRLAGIITERCGDRRELGSARLPSPAVIVLAGDLFAIAREPGYAMIIVPAELAGLIARSLIAERIARGSGRWGRRRGGWR